jgi:methanogenic corrinoid protein MtbC1
MPAMKKTVKTLKESGLKGFNIMVGGAPVTAEFAASIGADAYTADAGSAAVKAKELATA